MRLAMTSALLLSAAFVYAELPPLVSIDELKQMFKDGKYAEVVKETTRQAAQTGPSAASIDKFAVLTLKGESQIRVKQAGPAAESFAKAAKEAKDPKEASLARATELLLKKSPTLAYLPKPTKGDTAKPTPISVVEEADRKKAFEALWTDEWATVSPKLEKFKAEKSLPPVMDAVKLVGSVRAIDVAAHGEATESAAAMTDLGDHARTMINEALTTMMSRIATIETEANKTQNTQIGDGGGGVFISTKRGLYSPDTKELKGIIDTCGKIAPASAELAAATGEEASKFDDVKTKSEEVAARAKEVLDADYGNGGSTTGSRPGGNNNKGNRPNRPGR